MTIIVILHVLVCFALILIVLLQAGKGAEMGAAFGGASQTLFGSAGAMGFLTKLTTVAAIVFMATSLILAFSSSRQVSSVMSQKPAQTAPAPETPAPVPEAPAPAPVQPPTPAPGPGK